MSEQSGPITREQVERAIAKPGNIDYRELPRGWREWAPDYVIAADDAADDWDAEHAALTRWRDELVAAETPRKVARWDARRGAYVALDGHGTVCMITPDRETAIAWGYAIEGGHEPERDWKSDRAIAAIWPTPTPAEDSPERLRERREALGLSTEQAADLIKDGWCDEDIARCEDPRSVCDPRARTRYAAALSAEEARRAAVGAWAAGGGVLHYSRPTELERPAPRFKVRDPYGDGDDEPVRVEVSPPAPKVVDVPQPVVIRKRLAGSEHSAAWSSDEPDVVTLYIRSAGEDAPLALLRAMLAAIDAQQGGA